MYVGLRVIRRPTETSLRQLKVELDLVPHRLGIADALGKLGRKQDVVDACRDIGFHP